MPAGISRQSGRQHRWPTSAQRLMVKLKLAINPHKTRGLRYPEESFVFPGYRKGCNYRPNARGATIGSRPGKASVQGFCSRISEQTHRRHVGQDAEEMVERLWAAYGLLRLVPKTKTLPGAGMCSGRKAGCGNTTRPV